MTVQPWGCFLNGAPPDPGGDVPAISFFVRNNTNQSIPDSSWTWLNLSNIKHETPINQISLVNETWTVPFDGHYFISAQIQMDVYFAYTTVAIEFHRNGSLFCQSTDYNTFDSIHALNLVTADQMTAGETWKLRMFQNSGASANLLSSNCYQNHICGFCNYLL